MIIKTDMVVTIQYTLKDDSGEIIDSSNEDGLSYIHGKGFLVPGLEKELENKQTGDMVKVTIDPKDGYGEYDESLVFSVSKEKFKDIDHIKKGMKFRANTHQGEKILSVRKIDGDRVTVDMNHPLAGKKLHFDVTVMNISENAENE